MFQTVAAGIGWYTVKNTIKLCSTWLYNKNSLLWFGMKRILQKTKTITLIFPNPYSEEDNSSMELFFKLFFTFSDEKVSFVCLYKTHHAVVYCQSVALRLLRFMWLQGFYLLVQVKRVLFPQVSVIFSLDIWLGSLLQCKSVGFFSPVLGSAVQPFQLHLSNSDSLIASVCLRKKIALVLKSIIRSKLFILPPNCIYEVEYLHEKEPV